MQIVIDIPEEQYSLIKQSYRNGMACLVDKECMMYAIRKGTPLPKGHGRLIDADALENYIKEDADEWDEYALAYVEDAPTIIEGDKESE